MGDSEVLVKILDELSQRERERAIHASAIPRGKLNEADSACKIVQQIQAHIGEPGDVRKEVNRILLAIPRKDLVHEKYRSFFSAQQNEEEKQQSYQETTDEKAGIPGSLLCETTDTAGKIEETDQQENGSLCESKLTEAIYLSEKLLSVLSKEKIARRDNKSRQKTEEETEKSYYMLITMALSLLLAIATRQLESSVAVLTANTNDKQEKKQGKRNVQRKNYDQEAHRMETENSHPHLLGKTRASTVSVEHAHSEKQTRSRATEDCSTDTSKMTKDFTDVDVVLIGDAMTQHVCPTEFYKNKKVEKFDSTTIFETVSLLSMVGSYENVKEVILHVGTYDVAEKSARFIADQVKGLTELIREKFPKALIAVSSILPHQGNNEVNRVVDEVNSELRALCKSIRDCILVRHNNLSQTTKLFYHDGIHVNFDGTRHFVADIKRTIASHNGKHQSHLRNFHKKSIQHHTPQDNQSGKKSAGKYKENTNQDHARQRYQSDYDKSYNRRSYRNTRVPAYTANQYDKQASRYGYQTKVYTFCLNCNTTSKMSIISQKRNHGKKVHHPALKSVHMQPI